MPQPSRSSAKIKSHQLSTPLKLSTLSILEVTAHSIGGGLQCGAGAVDPLDLAIDLVGIVYSRGILIEAKQTLIVVRGTDDRG